MTTSTNDTTIPDGGTAMAPETKERLATWAGLEERLDALEVQAEELKKKVAELQVVGPELREMADLLKSIDASLKARPLSAS